MGIILDYIHEKNLKVNPLFSFLKPFLCSEKITMLQTINEDNIIDKDIFCDFFLSNEYYFEKLANKTGFIDYFELMTIIYLMKQDLYNSTIANIISLFIFGENEELISTDNFYFMIDTFINSVQKLYSVDFFENNENFKEELDKDINSYYQTIFSNNSVKEAFIQKMKQKFLDDPDLKKLWFLIKQQSDSVLKEN